MTTTTPNDRTKNETAEKVHAGDGAQEGRLRSAGKTNAPGIGALDRDALVATAQRERLRPILCRFDRGRLTCPAQDAIAIIDALEFAGWHCRDIQESRKIRENERAGDWSPGMACPSAHARAVGGRCPECGLTTNDCDGCGRPWVDHHQPTAPGPIYCPRDPEVDRDAK